MNFKSWLVVAALTGAAVVAKPPALLCPPAPPVAGSVCSQAQFSAPARCNYPGLPRCPFAHCVDVAGALTWNVTVDHCKISCPAAVPDAGTACPTVSSDSCQYRGGEKCGFRAHCSDAGWQVEELTLCGGM